MEASFWHNKWGINQIGFHQNITNPLLIKHLEKLALDKGGRIFIPLCGKTVDIAWLLSEGYQVAGAELSEIAIKQLFEALGVTPEISKAGPIIHYHADNIDMFVGDIFDLSAEMLGSVDGVFDRAALVALPPEMRIRYSKHLIEITDTAPQLLICFEYDQSIMNGPPFSIIASEVEQHYASSHKLKLLEAPNLEGGLKGRIEAIEAIWLLEKKSA
jgi:thiopurine S-methyltransferase